MPLPLGSALLFHLFLQCANSNIINNIIPVNIHFFIFYCGIETYVSFHHRKGIAFQL